MLFICIFQLTVFTGSAGFGQASISMLDYNRIPQKEIIDFLEIQKKSGNELFCELVPVCYRIQDSVLYRKVSTNYIIEKGLKDVWEVYINIKPCQAYNGRRVGFGFLYSGKEDNIIYREDPFSCLEVGQIYFFRIKLVGGLLKMAIGSMVTGVDEDLNIIRFCYIKDGNTEGTQEIRMSETPEGFTKITHDTWFKSDSRFRDAYLYPYFHTQTINEYHFMMRKGIEKHEEFPCH